MMKMTLNNNLKRASSGKFIKGLVNVLHRFQELVAIVQNALATKEEVAAKTAVAGKRMLGAL